MTHSGPLTELVKGIQPQVGVNWILKTLTDCSKFTSAIKFPRALPSSGQLPSTGAGHTMILDRLGGFMRWAMKSQAIPCDTNGCQG
jgi:hypothetical protein